MKNILKVAVAGMGSELNSYPKSTYICYNFALLMSFSGM